MTLHACGRLAGVALCLLLTNLSSCYAHKALDLRSDVRKQSPQHDGEPRLQLWPFSSNKDSATSSSCNELDSCEPCNSAYTCHWCSFDQQCHAIGSRHGCMIGSSCSASNDKKKNATGCAAHETCTECALSSYHTCHWCAHDNACHTVGMGCVSGVDCYDNSRCQRPKPEPLQSTTSSWKQIGALPLLAIGFMAAIIVCCASACCGIAGGVKAAYDDLVDLTESETTTPPVAVEAPAEEQVADTPTPFAQAEEEATVTIQEPEEESAEGVDDDAVISEMQQLLQDEEAAPNDYIQLADIGTQQPVASRRRRKSSIHRMYNMCVGCYIATLVFVGLFVYGSIRYFPKKPVYNICNDSVAWKSLIDSMTGMKVTADFELLASVSNPNHVDAALDMGKGTFSHNGAFVGTYEIPPVIVAANSITDILIVATFAPEKWDALSITAEYYRGTLVLSVDAEMTIRIPALMDYAFTASMKNFIVHVNEMSDRHLCACPTWSDARNHTMSVPHWVRDDKY